MEWQVSYCGLWASGSSTKLEEKKGTKLVVGEKDWGKKVLVKSRYLLIV